LAVGRCRGLLGAAGGLRKLLEATELMASVFMTSIILYGKISFDCADFTSFKI
jgi:hypothetical protein